MEIPPEFIEFVLKQQNIEYRHYPDKEYFQISNPFTDDRKFHMGLSYRLQTYNCFKSSEKGGLFFFFQKLLKVPEDKLVGMISKFAVRKTTLIQEKEEVVEKGVVHYHEVPYDWVLIDDIPAQPTKAMHYLYLLSRNLSREKILRNKFFYSHRDTSRVVIPYYMNGQLVNWIARDILGTQEKKYLYPKEVQTKNKRSDMVYNYDHANRDELIICEGQFNALVVDGVAIGGKDLSEMQLKIIRAMKPKAVILAFDQDVPGKKAIAKTLPQIAPYFEDNLFFISAEVSDRDFSDMGEEEARRYISEHLVKHTPASAYAEKFFH